MQNECEFVQVRLRAEEKRQWRQVARRLDLSVAQLVRRAVRAYAIRHSDEDDGPASSGGGPR